MRYGNLLALAVFSLGIIGVVYGISLNDDSSFGIVVISGACTFPIAGAIRMRTSDRTNDFFQKEIKFTNVSGGK